MKTKILDIQGKEKGHIELPNCFSQEIREDIVAKVLESKNRNRVIRGKSLHLDRLLTEMTPQKEDVDMRKKMSDKNMKINETMNNMIDDIDNMLNE